MVKGPVASIWSSGRAIRCRRLRGSRGKSWSRRVRSRCSSTSLFTESRSPGTCALSSGVDVRQFHFSPFFLYLILSDRPLPPSHLINDTRPFPIDLDVQDFGLAPRPRYGMHHSRPTLTYRLKMRTFLRSPNCPDLMEEAWRRCWNHDSV